MLNKVWAQIATGAAVFVSITGSALAVDVNAGPIWNQSDAQGKCPSVCSNAKMTWNGNWATTVPGQMSVCGCNPPAVTPAPAQQAPMPQPQPMTPPAQAPKPMMPPPQPQMPQAQPMTPQGQPPKPMMPPPQPQMPQAQPMTPPQQPMTPQGQPPKPMMPPPQPQMPQAQPMTPPQQPMTPQGQPPKPMMPPPQPQMPQAQPMTPPQQPMMPQGQPPMAQPGAQSGPCQAAAAMEKSVADMFAKYNTLTSNNQAGQKQQLKAQIGQATEQMNAAKAACAKQVPPCVKQVEEQSQLVGNMHAKYNTLTSNKQAGEKQQLKAQIIAEQTKLDQMKASCR